MKTCR